LSHLPLRASVARFRAAEQLWSNFFLTRVMKKSFTFSVILLAATSTIVYYPSLKGFFVSDDFDLINAIRMHGPWSVWTFHAGFFRPVISLSIFADYSIWRLNPVGYKLTNVVIHILNSILVILSAWLLTSRPAIERQISVTGSIAAGVIFALLPAHAEAVSWISGRTDVICTFFALGAWCAFLVYGQKHKTIYWAASSLAFTLALFSKEAAISLPLIMGLYVLYAHITKQKVRWLAKGALTNVAVLFLYFFLRYVAVGGIGGYGASVHVNLDPARWIAGPPIFLARVIWPCCWPAEVLSSSLALSEQIGFMRWFYLAIGLAFTAGIAGVAIVQISRRKLTWGIALFLLMAGVIAQLPSTSIGLQAETRIGERLVYLPSVFICSLIAFAITMLAPKYQRLIIAFILAVYGFTLWQTNLLWYEAGNIAKSILDSMRGVDASHPIAVILPDHLKGAFIFRNGIQPAADLFDIHGEWKAVALVTLDSQTDRFILETENGIYKLKAFNPKSAIIPLIPPATEVHVSPNNKSAQITLPNTFLVYYSDKQLYVSP
jgi:hypothetical protein